MNRLKNSSKSMGFAKKLPAGGGNQQRPSTTSKTTKNPSSSSLNNHRPFSFSTSTRSTYSASQNSSSLSFSSQSDLGETLVDPSSTAQAGGGGAADSMSGDEFMHFGTDINMVEDLTRTINLEISEINKAKESLQKGIRTETATETQLKKENNRARQELDDFKIQAEELVLSENVNDNMRSNFEAEIQRVLIQPLRGKQTDRTTTTTTDELAQNDDDGTVAANNNNNNNNNDDDDDDDDNSESWTSKTFLKNRGLKIQELQSLIDKEKINKIEMECQEIQEDINKIEQTIIGEKLVEVLEEKKKENETIGREIQAVRKSKLELQASIDTTRKNTAMYAQQITDRQKILDSNKKRNAEEMAQKKQELEDAQAELRSLKTKEEWEKELAEAEQNRNDVMEVLAKAQQMIEAYTKAKKDRQETETSLDELKTNQQDLQDKVATKQKALEESEKLLAEAVKEKETVEAEKAANDKYEAEVVRPAMEETSNIAKEKDVLSKKIAEMSETMSLEADEATTEEETLTLKVTELQEQANSLQEKVEESTKELDEIKKNRQEDSVRDAESIHELQTLHKSFEGAIQTEQENLATETKEHEDKVEASASALAEAVEARKEKDRQLQIVNVGVQLLAKTNEEVQNKEEEWKLRESEILNGENLNPTIQPTPEQIQTSLEGFVTQNLCC